MQAIKDNQAKKLSGGQKRKLSLGIAVLGNPKVNKYYCHWWDNFKLLNKKKVGCRKIHTHTLKNLNMHKILCYYKCNYSHKVLKL